MGDVARRVTWRVEGVVKEGRRRRSRQGSQVSSTFCPAIPFCLHSLPFLARLFASAATRIPVPKVDLPNGHFIHETEGP